MPDRSRIRIAPKSPMVETCSEVGELSWLCLITIFKLGKSSINRPCSIAMSNDQKAHMVLFKVLFFSNGKSTMTGESIK